MPGLVAEVAKVDALAALGDAMREVNAAIDEMLREHDPLASHIFISRRLYQNKSDTKSGKRHHLSTRLSWQQACELGFRGDLGEWERLLGGGCSSARVARRPMLPRARVEGTDGFQGLRAYKEKFNPAWEPHYLAYPGGMRLPRIIADVSALIAGGYLGILRK
jgi:hypothetical protein